MEAPSEANNGVLIADLLALVTAVGFVVAVSFAPVVAGSPVAAVVGLLFVLFVPGYALVCAVFPRAGDTGVVPSSGTSWLARLVLSVVGSVVAVAVVGGVLDFTIVGFDRTAVVLGLCLLTLAATAVAWYRRRRLPAAVQAGATGADVLARTRHVVGRDIISIALTLVVIVATAGAIGVVANEPTDSGSVTELYILGENESGQLTAANYPSNLTAGEPVTLGVGVGTTRDSGFDGRVVATIEQVSVEGETTTVTESQPLGAFDVQVAADERAVRRHTIQPSLLGERLRLTYRLYEADSDTPLRRVQIWVSVRRP